MPYEPSQRWLLEPAKYYEEERGIVLIDTWNRIVRLQMQLIDAKEAGDTVRFREIWNEAARLRRTIQPFVSKDGTLFMLASIFDNIANVGMAYIVNQYKVMAKLQFMIEILNYVVDKIDHCYYQLSDQHKYYHADNSTFIRDFAEDTDFSWAKLADRDSRMDADCNPSEPLEICFDWGSSASFLEVAQTIIDEAVKMEQWLVEKYGEDDDEYLDHLDEYEKMLAEKYELDKKMGDGYFSISRLHRDDLEAAGFDAKDVDDATMERMADKMGDDYVAQLFWNHLPVFAEEFGVPRKEVEEEN